MLQAAFFEDLILLKIDASVSSACKWVMIMQENEEFCKKSFTKKMQVSLVYAILNWNNLCSTMKWWITYEATRYHIMQHYVFCQFLKVAKWKSLANRYKIAVNSLQLQFWFNLFDYQNSSWNILRFWFCTSNWYIK